MKSLMTVFLLIATLCGCTAAPKVHYEEAGQKAKGTRFQLSESVLHFAFPEEGSGITKGVNANKLVITSVPVPMGKTYVINGTGAMQNWGVKTTLNATHRNDTLLLQEVGSEVTDTRKQLISDVASVITNGMALFGATKVTGQGTTVTAVPGPPAAIVVSSLKSSTYCSNVNRALMCKDYPMIGGGLPDKDGKLVGYTATILIEPLPDNSVTFDDKNFSFPRDDDALFYSACRNLLIEVKNEANPSLAGTASLRIADPAAVELISFPQKGKITLGASCGADAVAQDANLPTAIEYVNSLLSAAKSVKDAASKMSSEKK